MRLHLLILGLCLTLGQTFASAPPNITLTSTDTSACEGGPLSLWIQAEANGTATFQWQFEGTDIEGAESPALLITDILMSEEGMYRCVVSNETGHDTAFFDVNVLPTPVAAFTVSDGCVGTPIDIAENTSISAGTFSSEWSLSNGSNYTDELPSDTLWSSTELIITLSVTSDSGCVDMSEKVVQIADTPQVETALTHIKCNGNATGSVELSASGGSDSYLYQFDGSLNTSGIFEGYPAGSYNYIVIDNNGCSAWGEVTLTEPVKLKGKIDKVAEPTCYGDSDGWVELSASGGKSPYSFSACCGLFSNDTILTNLAADSYTMKVRDVNNCVASLSVNLGQPDSLYATTSSTAVTCFGDADGEVVIVGMGGTSPLIYKVGENENQYGEFGNLAFGDYSFTVVDDHECTVNGSFSIATPEALSVSDISTTNVTCSADNGTVSFSSAGGSGPITYALKTLVENWGNQTYMDSGIYHNLATGKYQLRVKDSLNCTADSSATLYLASSAVVLDSVKADGTTCFATATGAVHVFTKDSTSRVTLNSILQDSAMFSFKNLPADVYNITVTSQLGCSAMTQVEVVDAGSFELYVDSISDAQCSNDSTGYLRLVSLLDSALYTANDFVSNDGVFPNLPNDKYQVAVALNGCRQELELTIDYLDTPPVADYLLTTTEGAAAFLNQSQNADRFVWHFGDETTSTDLNPIHNYPTKNIIYKSKLLAYNDCGVDSVEKYVELGYQSVGELGQGASWTAYPNPTTGIIYTTLAPEQTEIIHLFDALGRKIEVPVVGGLQIGFDLNELTNGTYWLVDSHGQSVAIRLNK